MQHLLDALAALFGQSTKAEDLGILQGCARALLVYIALIVIVRFGKKRFLGRASAFDAILVITIGSIASRGITANSPLFTALGAVVTLVAVHWIISYIARSHEHFGNLIKGTDTTLIADGKVDRRALAAAHMSRDDLDEDLRQKGVADPSGVKEARLERSGRLSVLKYICSCRCHAMSSDGHSAMIDFGMQPHRD